MATLRLGVSGVGTSGVRRQRCPPGKLPTGGRNAGRIEPEHVPGSLLSIDALLKG